MAESIMATDVVQAGFPPEEGERLADAILERQSGWEDLQIDVRQCPPSLLISAFFNAFLQRIHEREGERLPEARQITWLAEYPFQQENIETWVSQFEPQ